jgi:hypothetical protein
MRSQRSPSGWSRALLDLSLTGFSFQLVSRRFGDGLLVAPIIPKVVSVCASHQEHAWTRISSGQASSFSFTGALHSVSVGAAAAG